MYKLNPRPWYVFCHLRQCSGGGLVRPPADRPLIVVDLRLKKQSMRLDGISRMHILFLVLGQHLISLDQVKGQIFAKIDIFFLYTLIAA